MNNTPEKKISHERAIELLQKCMDWMSEYGTYETSILRDALLESCGFTREEIEVLGFGYVFPEGYDEDED